MGFNSGFKGLRSRFFVIPSLVSWCFSSETSGQLRKGVLNLTYHYKAVCICLHLQRRKISRQRN